MRLSSISNLPAPITPCRIRTIEKVKAILEHPEVKAVIPAENQIAWSTGAEIISGRKMRELYLLKSKVELSGTHLTDARPNYDQYHKPIVDFTFDREGGNIFGRVTGPNIGKPLAILLDGKVESAPNIRSKIRDKGQIQLGGQRPTLTPRILPPYFAPVRFRRR